MHFSLSTPTHALSLTQRRHAVLEPAPRIRTVHGRPRGVARKGGAIAFAYSGGPLSGSSPQAAPPFPSAMAQLAAPFLGVFELTSHSCLNQMEPSLIVSYLSTCGRAGHVPSPAWLVKLYKVWEASMSQTDLKHTVGLLLVLAKMRVQPPESWVEAVYYQVGENHRSLSGQEVISFLEAACWIESPKLDRDLILGLSQQLLSPDGEGSSVLALMSPKDAARLLTAFAGNGQPPGSLMAGATLRVIAPAVISAQISIEQLVDALEAVALAAGIERQLPTCPDVDSLTAISQAVSSHLASTAETDPRLAIRCLSALATCRMPASSLPAITAVLQPSLHQLPPDSLSLLIVALKRSGYVLPKDWVEEYHTAVGKQLGSFENTHELVDLLKALEDMDIPMGFSFLNKLADDVATRAKSNAVQTLRDPSKASTSSDPVHPQVDLEGPVCLYLLATVNHKPGYERVQAMVTALQPHLPNLPAMHLTNTLWALARLGHPLETPWLLEARAAVAHQQSLMLSQAAGADDDSLKPYQLAFIFGSLQSLRCPMDATFVDQMLDCVAYSLPAMLPHNVALVMGTVAKLQHVTSYTWMGAVEDHVSLRLEAYSPKELATVVWGMAKLHHRPSAEWTTAFQEGCFEVMDTFDPGNLSTLVWAFAELGQIPCNDWMERFCSTSGLHLDRMSPQDLVSLLPSFVRLGYQPETEWLSDYLSIVHAYLPALNGQAFATIVKGLQDMDAAVSGREFWDAFCSAMRAKLPSMSPQALVDVASGLAFASYEPSPAWTSTFLQACEKSRDSFSPQELNQLVCSMAQLKAVPQQGLLKNFLNRTPAVLPTLEPASITASASALALFWSLPAEASPCTPDDASPWVEALVQAARGNINSFGLAQLNELTKVLLQIQTYYRDAPGVTSADSPLRDFLAYLREFFIN